MDQHWHSLDINECEKQLSSNIKNGLSQPQVEQSRQRHGDNLIEQADAKSLLSILTAQFKDFMIIILILAAVISGFIGDLTDTVIILVIVLLNAILGTFQEYRAEKAMQALKALATPESEVCRDGVWTTLPSMQLVPGDLIRVEAGNLVPADARLIQANDVEADESALTGESQSVVKSIQTLSDEQAPIAERSNMLFKGTQINRGMALGLVVATGMKTELGNIASLLDNAQESQSPLQQRLARFGKRLAISILLVCLLVFLLGVARGEPWLLMLLTGISLAVAAIPEALPAVVSIALALGAAQLSRSRALMRNLPAVETLGSVTYICSDKTGTLTQNKMHVDKLICPESYPAELNDLSRHIDLAHTLAISNDVSVEGSQLKGEATEMALTQFAHDNGFLKPSLEQQLPRIKECAFDSTRKRMSTLHQLSTTESISFTKGAPESVIPLCDDIDQLKWVQKAEALASEGYRVLAFAKKEYTLAAQSVDPATMEIKLCFLGLAALIDPPRPEAKQAVKECRSAGIKPVMITGDHPATACAIAQKIGLIDQHNHQAVTGREMSELSDDELQRTVQTVSVYARVSPEQKVRLVNALKANGEFCAMTGDGVNDAPALKNAHIGIAMGMKGTDVAREASDMVLLDDNFATIVTAVKKGRQIFDNIRKFIKYTMTSNSGEIWVLLLAPLLGMPIPLLPIHILWINLVTDGLPGLALSLEPAERNLMQRPPRPPNENIFANGMWQHIVFIGLLIGGLSLFAQFWALNHSPDHWQTMIFTTLTLAQLCHVLVIRSERDSIFTIGLLSNRPLIFALLGTFLLQLAVVYHPIGNSLFKTTPLPLMELVICIALASVIIFAVEVEKYVGRKKSSG